MCPYLRVPSPFRIHIPSLVESQNHTYANMFALKEVIEKYLLFWLLMLSGVAFFADRILPLDVFAKSGNILPYLIVVTMFAIGWMLPTEEVRQVLSHWPSVFGGTAIQFVTMPMLAYVLATQFQLTDGLFIGTMMVGCVPGAMASNVLTLMAGGNTGYSVCLTTTATLLSPLVVPFALWLTLGNSVDPNTFWQAAVKLSWMVLIPVVLGYVLSQLRPEWKTGGSVVGSIAANLTILWIIAFVVAKNRDYLATMEWLLVPMLLILNLLGYAAGFFGGKLLRLPFGMRRALTLEVGMQNAGLGTALVKELFPDDASVLVPPALYTFGCMLTGTLLARIWNRQNTDAMLERADDSSTER